MPKLVFKIAADYEAVIRLREEISKLEAQLKKMDVNKSPAAARALETQLASTRQQMMGLVTEAAKTGAVMENDLKNKLNSASKASDELTEEIIKQRKIIRDTQDDVRRLSDEYSKMGRYSPNSKAKLAELNRAKAALNEQRYAMGELQDQQAKNRLEVRKLTREYKEFAQGGSNADEVVKSLTDSLKRTAAEFGGLVAIKKFVSDVIDATGKMQQLDVALSTILQSKSKADALLAEISEFAKKTPFNLDEVANGAKQLLAYGSSAENVVSELSMLGDVASGLQIPLGQLIYLYGTLRVQGRAYWRDIQQFQGRGVNVIEEMAKNLGVTQDQIKSLVEEGKIGFKDVEKAFQSMTSEGGKFNNMLENSAGTWPQRIANIEDTIFTKLNEFGNKYKEVFELGIGTAEDLVESLDDVISVIGALVAAYGTYKAALIAVAVWQKASSILNMTKSFLNLAKGVNVATAAMKAFNITSKANLFGALFSVIAGVTTAVYMFTKRADEATESQKRLNEASANYEKEVASEIAEVDRLFDKLKNAKKGTDEYNSAKAAIINQYGTYLNGLSEEIRTLKNVEGAYDAVTKAVQKAARARGMESAIKGAQEEYGELYGKSAGKLYKELTNIVGEKKAKSFIDSIKKELEKTGTISKGLTETIANVFRGDANYGNSKAWMQSMKNATKNLKDTYKAAEAIFSDSSLDTKPSTKADVDDKSYWEKQKKELQGQLDALSSKEAAGKKGLELRKKIASIEEKLKPYSAEYDNKRDKTAIKSYNSLVQQENKISEIERKQAIERSKEAEELVNQVEQARINAMADGSKKIIAQREYDNKKELAAIDRAKEEYIQKEIQRQKEIFDAEENLKAQKNPKYKKKSFNSSAVSVDTSSFDELKYYTEQKQLQDRLKAEKDAMNTYLMEYGTYQQRKLAIAEEYAQKIQEAQNEGERLTLIKEREKSISDVNLSAIKQNIDWAGVFGDFGTMLRDEIEQSLEAVRKYMKSDEFRSMAPEDQAKIVEAVNNLRGNVSGNLSDINFKEIGELTTELQNAQRKMITAYSAEIAAYDNLKKAQDNYHNAMESGTSEQKLAAKSNLDTAQIVADNMSQAYKQAVGEFNATGNNLKDATDSAVDAINSVSSSISQIRSNSLSSAYEGTQQLTETLGKSLSGLEGILGKAGGALSKFASSLGGATGEIVSAALGLLDLLKDGLGSIFADLSDLMFNAVNGILDDILSGGIIMKPLKSVVDGVSNILNTITFGGLNSWLGGNDKDVMKTVSRLTESNEYLQESIDRLRERIGDESNTAGQTLDYYLTAKDAEEQWRENQQEIIKNLASAWTNTGYGFMGLGGKGSFNGHAPDSSWSGWDYFSETLKSFGFDVTLRNSEDFWNLTPEQMELLRDNNPKEWQKLFDSDGHKNPLEAVEEYIEHAGELEELTNVLNENLTKISFDSLYDNFIDTLMDMDASAEDFADNMSEYFMRAVLSDKVGEMFKTRLNEWYNAFALAMKDGNLDDDELKNLRDDYENIVKDAMAERDDLANAIGYTSSDNEQQSASKKGYATASQDSIDELSGRTTAMYESNLRIETAEQQQTVAITELRGSISALTAQASGMYNIADETRTILANSYLELQQIRENTGEIIKPIKQMQADIAEVKRNTARL